MTTTEKPSIVQQTLQHQIDRLQSMIERDEARASECQKTADDLRVEVAAMRQNCGELQAHLAELEGGAVQQAKLNTSWQGSAANEHLLAGRVEALIAESRALNVRLAAMHSDFAAFAVGTNAVAYR